MFQHWDAILRKFYNKGIQVQHANLDKESPLPA